MLKFCEQLMRSGKYNFRWLCMPLESEKYILGHKTPYIQWDVNRQHIRPMPEWAEKFSGVRYQSKVYRDFAGHLKGRIAVCLGLRADESMTRYKAMFLTKNKYPYMNKPDRNITEVKPIYDWSEKDVFKFFYDFGIKYCETYNHQIFNGDKLRVSTPLHAEAARNSLLTLKTKDAILYDQIMTVFPEVEMQVRYFKECKINAQDFSKYERSWNGVIKFIRDVVDEELQESTIKKVQQAKRYREANKGVRPYGGYPLLYIFEVIATGTYKRFIAPIHDDNIKQKHHEFEADLDL